MNQGSGWLFLLLATGAGVALYYYERRISVPSSSTTSEAGAAATVVNGQGSCIRQNGKVTCVQDPDASNNAGQTVQPMIDDPGSDAGVSPQPRGQTEAAYNQGTDLGSGSEITYGPQADDYEFYDDPSEVTGV